MERPLLMPLVPFYRLGLGFDRWRRSRNAYRSPRAVISVGGITAGGAGKTPLVRWLVEYLQERVPVIVLSRGYGRRAAQPVIWRGGEPLPDPAEIGDEPAMLARSLRNGGIAVADDRCALLQYLDNQGVPGIVLLDDGFQHWRLQRDLDLVLVTEEAFRTGLLPAGNRREPLSGLGRARALLSYEAVALDRALPVVGREMPRLRLELVLDSVRSLATDEHLELDRPVLLLTGIARPERVVQQVHEEGVEIAGHLRYRDHVDYTPELVAEIERVRREKGAEWVLTTEKDGVKLREKMEKVAYLRMETQGEGLDGLKCLINPLLQ